MSELLFYLLLLLLPTQLGRHFFFDFSYISGIRSDYLAPTIYVTDIIILFLFVVEVGIRIGKKKFYSSGKKNFLLFVLSFLLFNSIVIASNKWAAIYKLVKIIEMIALGKIITRIKPKITSVIITLSVGVFYSSVIAVWQFLTQKSIGGLFYWLGERSFSAASPGIAAFSINNSLVLRPYASFSHPNALGGFLAVSVTLLLYILVNKNVERLKYYWIIFTFFIGVIALILTFSRAAWLVCGFGMLLVLSRKISNLPKLLFKHHNFVLTLIYVLILISVILPLIFRPDVENWKERTFLIAGAIRIISSQPLFGVGLNNSIIQMREFIKPDYGLYIFQPVHNIFLLVITETGLIGFSFFLLFFAKVFYKSIVSNFIVFLTFILLIFLGMFDHYIFTLQQGQLLFTLFVSLALTPEHKAMYQMVHGKASV